MLEIKHQQTPAYELIRALELEDDLESTARLADLAGACSPVTRVVMGTVRLFTAATATLISAFYILFGAMYDAGPTTRWAAALVFGVTDVPGVVFAAFLAPPFALVGVVALRDLLRQIETVYDPTPQAGPPSIDGLSALVDDGGACVAHCGLPWFSGI